jgi:hypothetical protein
MQVFIKVQEFQPIRDYLSDVKPGFYRLVDAYGCLGEDWSVLRHLNGAENHRSGLLINPDFNEPTQEEYKFLLRWFRIHLKNLSPTDISLFMSQSPGTLARIRQDFRKEVDLLNNNNQQYQKDINHFTKVLTRLENFKIPEHNTCWPETYLHMFQPFMKDLKVTLFGRRLESDLDYPMQSRTIYTFQGGFQGEQVKEALLKECNWLITRAIARIKKNQDIIDRYPV